MYDEKAEMAYAEEGVALRDQSNVDAAIERCRKAETILHHAWDSLRERIDVIVQPAEPSIPDDNALAALRRPESRLVTQLNGHAAGIESLAAAMRDVTDRLDS